MAGKIFAIGDIHGSLNKLIALINKIDWRPENGDRLIFLGDYIDRGPNGPEVIDFILELQQKSPRIMALCGNHEQMFLDFISGRGLPVYTANGLSATIRSYAGRHQFPLGHLKFFNSLKLYYETETHIFAHAGLRDRLPVSEQNPSDLLWIRDEFLKSDYDHGKTIVFGHTPFREPYLRPGKIGIDTGAVYGGNLTCLVLPDNTFISV